jgi:hypothetical protein
MVAVEAITETRINLDRIAGYIENCQTEDGGFFFARIPPSPAADTYHAVKSLQLLGRGPANSDAVKSWLREAAGGGLLSNPQGVFFLVETGLALAHPIPELRGWAAGLSDWANAEGGFGAWRNVDVEVSSELDITYRAVTTKLDLGLELDSGSVSRFLLHFLNIDGGFGAHSFSTLASTFYAVQTLSRLGYPPLDLTVEWLRRREVFWDVLYLEQLHRLVISLTALGEIVRERDRAIDFVLHCRRENGGFARARFGIPTLEYTHYALDILRTLEVI